MCSPSFLLPECPILTFIASVSIRLGDWVQFSFLTSCELTEGELCGFSIFASALLGPGR